MFFCCNQHRQPGECPYRSYQSFHFHKMLSSSNPLFNPPMMFLHNLSLFSAFIKKIPPVIIATLTAAKPLHWKYLHRNSHCKANYICDPGMPRLLCSLLPFTDIIFSNHRQLQPSFHHKMVSVGTWEQIQYDICNSIWYLLTCFYHHDSFQSFLPIYFFVSLSWQAIETVSHIRRIFTASAFRNHTTMAWFSWHKKKQRSYSHCAAFPLFKTLWQTKSVNF